MTNPLEELIQLLTWRRWDDLKGKGREKVVKRKRKKVVHLPLKEWPNRRWMVGEECHYPLQGERWCVEGGNGRDRISSLHHEYGINPLTSTLSIHGPTDHPYSKGLDHQLRRIRTHMLWMKSIHIILGAVASTLLSLRKWQTISALDAGDTLNWVSMPLIAGDRMPHETFTKWKQSVKMLERRAPGDVPNVNSPGDDSRTPSLLKFLFCHYHFLHSLVPSLFVCQASLCKHGGFFIHSRILFTSVFEDETLR